MDYLLGDDKASKIDFGQLPFDHDRTVAAGSEHIGFSVPSVTRHGGSPTYGSDCRGSPAAAYQEPSFLIRFTSALLSFLMIFAIAAASSSSAA